MHDDIQKILLTKEQIAARVAELGQTLAQEYARKDPVFIGVLKGVVVFFADMVRRRRSPVSLILWPSRPMTAPQRPGISR